jgi:SAM-dependent MidA family methyltransferase
MQPSRSPSARPAILEALRARARGKPAVSFEDFMDVALYEPGAGYYRRAGPRIGYGPGTDFLTATASAPIFGKVVAAACGRILGPETAAQSQFVEIGAEPGVGVLRGVPHPFKSVRQVGIGEPLRIEGPSVVFSNELFDAQPFRRFRFRDGSWRELGVSVGPGALAEVELDPGDLGPAPFPASASEGYVIDAPLASAALARRIAEEPWSGLFLALDYGKSWEEIAFETPAGTARAYHGHSQGNDLLERPGEQDLTCHVCWDWIAEALRDGGFAEPRLESQEAFFTLHSGEFLSAVTASEAGRMSREKLSILQLLHPAHMGQKFQALWATRPVVGSTADSHRLQA